MSTVCHCDSCAVGEPLSIEEVFSISPSGDVPSDPSPAARGSNKVYKLLCKEKFIKLYEGHGNTVTPDAIKRSHSVALKHLRMTGRLPWWRFW